MPQLSTGKVSIGVPIDIPFTEVNKLLKAQLVGKTFPEDKSGSIDVTIRNVEVAATGEQLLISLAVNAHERSIFSFGTDATIHVYGKPQLDRQNQILRLTDIELDINSAGAFGLVGTAARAAIPDLKPTLAAFDNTTLRVIAEAEGSLNVAVSELGLP